MTSDGDNVFVISGHTKKARLVLGGPSRHLTETRSAFKDINTTPGHHELDLQQPHILRPHTSTQQAIESEERAGPSHHATNVQQLSIQRDLCCLCKSVEWKSSTYETSACESSTWEWSISAPLETEEEDGSARQSPEHGDRAGKQYESVEFAEHGA